MAGISFNNFEYFCSRLVKNAAGQEDFTDVTLVSDDEKYFRVHKVIISAFSAFFKRVLTNSFHSTQTIIHLRGVNESNLHCLINFMYLGQTEVAQDNLDQFMKLAREFQIAGISNLISEFEEPNFPHNSNNSKNEEYQLQEMREKVREENKIVHKEKEKHQTYESKIYVDEVEPSSTLIDQSWQDSIVQPLDDYREKFVGQYWRDEQIDTETMTTNQDIEHSSEKDLPSVKLALVETNDTNETYRKNDYQKDKIEEDAVEAETNMNLLEKKECEKSMFDNLDQSGQSTAAIGDDIQKENEGDLKECEDLDEGNYIIKEIGSKSRRIIICDQCGYKTNYTSNLIKHRESVHLGAKFQCHICAKLFRFKDYVKIHIAKEHNGVRYPCQFCGFKFRQAGHLRRHLYNKHDGYVEEMPTKKKVLKKKLEYVCNVCKMKYRKKDKLKMHLHNVHKAPKRSHGIQESTLISHNISLGTKIFNVNGPEKIMYPCNSCGNSFKQAHLLKKHLENVHNTEYSKNF